MPIDIAGFVTYLKDHAVEHGFHVHGERHYIESYSLGQSWEVELHPESACDGPLDLHLAFDVDPRILLALDDRFEETGGDTDASYTEYELPLFFRWALPSLADPPDLLLLATDLAAVGGPELPIEVSAIDTYGATDAPERRLDIVGKVQVPLAEVVLGRQSMCEVLDRCLEVSEALVAKTEEWGPIFRDDGAAP